MIWNILDSLFSSRTPPTLYLKSCDIQGHHVQGMVILFNKFPEILPPLILKNTHVQGMIISHMSNKYNKFEKHLLWYLTIIKPLVCSLWSLEVAHTNTADIFVFWISAAAVLDDLFAKPVNETGILQALANQVTKLFNK